MSIAKKKAFNDKMSLKKKYPGHINLAKGGMVKNFDLGGIASGAGIGGLLAGPAGLIPGAAVGAAGPQAMQGTGPAGIVSNLLGTENNFQAGAAPITPGTTAAQLNTAYTGAQGALSGQQALADTLTPQAQTAVNNQNALASEFADQAAGRGTNVAGSQLNTATGQNVANQAALMAGQRGASGNVGLMARQAAMQGANTQQQAVGQAATLEQQQEIAAQQNQANLAQNQINQAGQAQTNVTNAQQGEQNILQGANTAANNANVGMQSNMNNVNAGVAAGNQSAHTNILGGLMGGASSALAGLGLAHGGAVHIHNYAAGGITTGNGNQGSVQPSGTGGGGGSPLNVPGTPSTAPDQTDLNESASDAVDAIKKGYKPGESGPIETGEMAGGRGDSVLGGSAGTGGTMETGLGTGLLERAYRGGKMAAGPHDSHVANYLAGGSVKGIKALVSPKEIYLSPDKVKKVIHEGADPFKIGYRFPGKDKKPGKDSKENDIIPTTLDDGGVVIDLETLKKKDPEKARKFVHRAVAKHMKKPKGS
jgi:hypothetical protein